MYEKILYKKLIEMYFYGKRNFIKSSHVLANFTKTSKFLQHILLKYCSVDFNLAP